MTLTATEPAAATLLETAIDREEAEARAEESDDGIAEAALDASTDDDDQAGATAELAEAVVSAAADEASVAAVDVVTGAWIWPEIFC